MPEDRAAIMLCQYCQSITIEGLVGKVGERKWNYDGMNHQPSFEALEESAISCELCQLFRHSILKGEGELDVFAEPGTDLLISLWGNS
jgi:hypothetical protein